MPKRKEEAPTRPTVELGRVGLREQGGIIWQDFLPELQGDRAYRVYEEMRRNDPVVGAILFGIDMALRAVDWRALPVRDEDRPAAELINQSMRGMSHSWADFISEVLTFIAFGFSLFELVYRRREDGRFVWRKFAFRAQDTISRWDFDSEGGIQGCWQIAPPDYKEIYLPIRKLLLFRTRHERNNPTGYSILRNAYRPWWYKKNLEAIEAIGAERDLAGLPIAELPYGATEQDKSDAQDLVERVHLNEQSGVVLPPPRDPKGEHKFVFRLLGAPGAKQFDTHQIITRYKQEILMSVLMTFIGLGTSDVGSFALVKGQKSFFTLALNGWIKSIEDTLNTFAVPRLLRLNGMDGQVRIKATEVGEADLDALGRFIERMAGVGLLSPDEGLEDYLRDVARLPPRPQERAVAKAQWQPNIRDKVTTLAQMRRAEAMMEGRLRRVLGRMTDWLEENWQEELE
jgi:hypothetical protein